MNDAVRLNSRWATLRWLFVLLLGWSWSLVPGQVSAHQTPSTMVLLDIQPRGVTAELQLPLGELELAFGHQVSQQVETLVARLGSPLRAYLVAHIHPISEDNRPWTVTVKDMTVQAAEQTASGPFQEITVRLWLQPPAGANSRRFTLNYDVILHQVVTHSALVSIRNDWERGVNAAHPVELGVIRVDTRTNRIFPLPINQVGGSWWNGFQQMVALGIQHIAEGTDHLLFLLVLLLPAPLLAGPRRWAGFGGIRYSLLRLLKVVSAFTLGHSLTLLAGTVGWLRLPSQPVEALIAFSILVSALHAWRPLFPGREAFVAAGFGLVHGLAFAGTLANLNLAPVHLALSILGFNLGIELMQLLVVALTVPWLILLSRTPAYSGLRTTGAVLAGIAALAWMSERLLGKATPIAALVERVAGYAPWLLGALAVTALVSIGWERYHRPVPPPL